MTDAIGGVAAPPRYTAEEVAAMFRVSTWWVQEQVRRGRVQCLRVGDKQTPKRPDGKGGRPAGRMQFEPQHIEQLRQLMQPPPAPERTRRRRRT